ncbi:DUF998 domain-containing protein [Actinomadura sp. 7K507]|uniref:DUF998 domain-containing protein n=1 Tax=Actinomadura sp. 7K507 TaxID=2530365 RepID=UPI001044413D|nr:DUF998 domain-containing protein [Actinomadura sp. 7K507]TDC79303.1 DUF998 domain-containing protein [Actinomadura sp. 7K507]
MERDRTTRALLAGGFGPALFAAVLLIESMLRPDYDALHHFGSELANGDRGWVMITNFAVSGALTLCFAAGLRRALPPGRGAVAGPALVALFGLGLIVAGVFVADPKPGYPPGTGSVEPTAAGVAHDGNLIPTWISMTAAMGVIAYRLAAEPGRRPWMWYTVVTAVASLTTLMIAVQLYDDVSGTGTYHGLWQRISITIGFTWFGALATLLLRSRRSEALGTKE